MPELPEVEKAASLIRDIAQNRIIQMVHTTEDKLVYGGINHEQFADILTGREVIGIGRYGKFLYLTLDGEGPMLVLHLGMTGMIHVMGQDPINYVKQHGRGAQVWPPRFMKFILHFAATSTSPAAQVAFADARRLGRIRLCASPLTEPPISNLGFDPLLSMPPLEEFSVSVRKRFCTIKSLLLDQSFSAGVGNWIADEALYQSRVHPEQRSNNLTEAQLTLLHHKIVDICRKAVDVGADSSRFPGNWLFKHRWDKGKKTKHTLHLPSGEPATIRWIKVGGRTSAYVTELQHLTGEDGILSEEAAEDPKLPEGEHVTLTTPSKRKALKSSPTARSSKRIK